MPDKRPKKPVREPAEKLALSPITSGKGKSDKAISLLHIFIITLAFAVVYVLVFDKKVDLNGDNASYYSLGKALATGKGYVNLADIRQSPENHFPPGYPFLISIVMRVFGESIMAVKLFDGVCILASILLIYFITIKITQQKTLAFATAFLLTLNSHLMLYSNIMMSEASFIMVSILTLFLVMQINEKQNLFLQPVLYLSLVTLAISYYIRSTGLALFGGIFLFFLLKKKWTAVIFYTAGFFIQVLPWYLRSRNLGGSSYIRPLVMINPYRPELGNAEWGDYLTRLVTNISRYVTREIPNSIFPFIRVNYLDKLTAVEWITGAIILLLIGYGFYRMKNFRILITAYIIATFGILFLWPEVWTGIRFILPIAPVLLIALLIGVYELFTMILNKLDIRTKFSPMLFLVLALFYIRPLQDLYKRASDDYPSNWKNYFEVAKYLKRQNIKDAVVCCRKADLFYLYSGTYTYTFPYIEDDKKMLQQLADNKVTHVVLDNLGYRQTYAYLLPAIQKNQGHFETVLKLSDPDTYLLKFTP